MPAKSDRDQLLAELSLYGRRANMLTIRLKHTDLMVARKNEEIARLEARAPESACTSSDRGDDASHLTSMGDCGTVWA